MTEDTKSNAMVNAIRMQLWSDVYKYFLCDDRVSLAGTSKGNRDRAKRHADQTVEDFDEAANAMRPTVEESTDPRMTVGPIV